MFCYLCKGTEGLYKYWVKPNGKPRYKCRPCNTEQKRRYRKTNAGKEAVLKAVQSYESKNPVRKKAWNKAIKLPSKPCIKCGIEPSHKHHPDIKKPLKIISLCALHHKEEHKMI